MLNTLPGTIGAGILMVFLLYWFLRWFERANVWIPKNYVMYTPADNQLDFEEVYFETEDGVKLHGWFVPAENPKASLLFCHGNAGNIGYRLESLRQFHSLNLNVFIFDYREYGKSEGHLSEEGTYFDGMAAFQWLRNREPNLPLVLFGRSMGSAIATELALRIKANALIFESGFQSIPTIGKEKFPFLPISWFNTIKYDSLSKIGKIDMPLLVVHSRDDDIVPFHHGKIIFDSAPEPKKFFELHGTHNEGHFLDEGSYLKGLSEFLEEYVLRE